MCVFTQDTLKEQLPNILKSKTQCLLGYTIDKKFMLSKHSDNFNIIVDLLHQNNKNCNIIPID